ncbi:MAG: TIGR00725 family protein [Actinobacteria bacterium]|nr:TIGR00725 family protein [Actinomycetota bacterium]
MAVVGAGTSDDALDATAADVGRAVASAGAILVCGGLGGVMEAACRGARDAGGITVGMLPGDDRRSANPHVTIAIPTGMGEMRNALIVRTVDAVIALGGEYGTLSEIALARKLGVPVVGVATWILTRPDGTSDDLLRASSAEDAVRLAVAAINDRG